MPKKKDGITNFVYFRRCLIAKREHFRSGRFCEASDLRSFGAANGKARRFARLGPNGCGSIVAKKRAMIERAGFMPQILRDRGASGRKKRLIFGANAHIVARRMRVR